jgi:hypothetical protein
VVWPASCAHTRTMANAGRTESKEEEPPMYRTHRLVRLLAPVALVGSIAATTPFAQADVRSNGPITNVTGHAATRSDGGGPTVGRGPTAHLRAYGGAAVLRGTVQHAAPSFCILHYPKICIGPA